MTLQSRIQRRKRQLEKEAESSRKFLSQAPEGMLVYQQEKGRVKWFLKIPDSGLETGERRKYIPKKEQALAEQLALKKYHVYRLKEVNQEIKALNAYLKYHKEERGKAFQKFLQSAEFQELVPSLTNSPKEKIKKWVTSSYHQNPLYTEQRNIHITDKIAVRSKSEALIAMKLIEHVVPFRYEAELLLEGYTFYPDFAICHPETGEVVYWEHLGMMERPIYREKTFAKLGIYMANGIVPGKNLILTFESAKEPLDMEWVEELILYHFQ